MVRKGLFWAVLVVVLGTLQLQAVEAQPGENLVEVKIALPKGDLYMRGATDPVSDLAVEVTLTNRTPKENFTKESVPVTSVERMTPDEVAVLYQKAASEKEKLTPEQIIAETEKKKASKSLELDPINKDSVGVAYFAPQLGPHEYIDFIITRLPEEGETVPEGAKPVLIVRDNKPSHIGQADMLPPVYLAAGESSPAYTLLVGKYYLINDPGKYSIKAVLRFVGDNQKPNGRAESNEETFRVLPYKIVDAKIDDLKDNWEQYERGTPAFDYMLYQVKTSGGWDEIYYVQRVPARGVNRWEWARLCTVKVGTQVQVAQAGFKKVALVAAQQKGDAGFYILDFNTIGPKITAKILELKEGAPPPKLKVEGGAASVE